MNRLTARNDSDGHYFRECLQKCAGEPERGACDYCKFLDEVCERLGQYEDREEAGKIPQELTDRYVESIAYRCMERNVHPFNSGVKTEEWRTYAKGITDFAEELKKFLKGEKEDEQSNKMR